MTEFFEKVYPGIWRSRTEEEFREQVRKDASASFAGETDKLFYHHVTDACFMGYHKAAGFVFKTLADRT
jgi:hypothetical protein